eukprot:CAMPEP_0115018638 /NCGR_PEP_ID=MMETSP0216-20121206/28950_1 /TAXON_ID=223996 /ORGANISM="Protocruzia adherens, Strain Boccale" /LENGTH=631 /DNA_ID=CAMNT_0002389921 /DNA_START=446 /DNA_END=2341 /DNA_ORIENTATION=+
MSHLTKRVWKHRKLSASMLSVKNRSAIFPDVELPSKLMVANRGEIANRIFQTCRRLGIETLGIYADNDLSSSHIKTADKAVKLQGKLGYLDAGQIVEISKEHDAQALHPGYGFLSENWDFAATCKRSGINFLGPSHQVIRDLGIKHITRELCLELEIPVIPGSKVLSSVDEAVEIAKELQYPVLIKASAGGGGIGIHKCDDETQLRAAYQKAKSQAKSFFKNSELFLEKYLQSARHIEIQLFGDGKGDVIHLGDRECSIQRRHQKIIEESPAPLLSDSLREKLAAAAIKIAKHLKYNSAGTAEFLVEGDNFYFLEINTRLQVEHTVTERVTGVDLVEWMIRQGSSFSEEAIQLNDFQPSIRGHSIEARIYAEDPANNFAPSPGEIAYAEFPDMPGVDVHTWVKTGTRVTPFYDPMIAKIVSYGENREEAIGKMRQALQKTELRGIISNKEYLENIFAEERYQSGKLDTHYLENIPTFESSGITIMAPGSYTTVQDWPGRTAEATNTDAWRIGIPPSGPMDHLSFRVANKLVGNDEGTAGLEATLSGPTIRFTDNRVVAVCGANCNVTVDGVKAAQWTSLFCPKGSVLKVGNMKDGARVYVAINGGIEVPKYLGSSSTLPHAGFGGHNGRTL